jgi:formyltetrahydrofolate synthetase
MAAGAARAVVANHWAQGGYGAKDLALAVESVCQEGKADFKLLYPDSMTIKEKLLKIATSIYGAKDVEYSPEAEEQIARYTALGFGSLPVCVAKTHLSLSADAKVKGVPTDFVLPVREVRASVGMLPASYRTCRRRGVCSSGQGAQAEAGAPLAGKVPRPG